jgi:hypothetical protein
MFLKKLLHQFVFFVDLVLLFGDIDLLRGVNIAVLAVTTLAMGTRTKGEKLLVNCKSQGMESTACNLLNSLMGKSHDPLWFLLKLSVAMSTLALVKLCSLSTSPGIEIPLSINRRAMVIAAGDHREGAPLHSLDDGGVVEVWRQIGLVLHVGATKLHDLTRVKEGQGQVVAATDLGHLLLALQLSNHMKLGEILLLDALKAEFAVQATTGDMQVAMGCEHYRVRARS